MNSISDKNHYCKDIFQEIKFKFLQFTDIKMPHKTKAKWKMGLVILGYYYLPYLKTVFFKVIFGAFKLLGSENCCYIWNQRPQKWYITVQILTKSI